jgi:hypothetical protein
MKKLFVWVLIVCHTYPGIAKGSVAHLKDTTEGIKQFMQKAQQAYRNTPYLSFHLLYRYANKNQPGKYIDSVAGDIAIDKNRMKMAMDGVETITNEKYTIQVIKEEKLIYLSVPKTSAMADPVAILDSAMNYLHGVRANLVHNKGLATLTFSFPEQPGQTYKSIAMTIDESTGYFQKVVYELYTAGLVSQDQVAQPGKPGLYQQEGRIEVLFSRYKKGEFNDSLFSEDKYFTRRGKGDYEPSAQYKDYQIFLASTNL